MDELMILLSTVIGTSLMTIASFADSKIRNKDFFEPKILNRLLYRIDALHSRNSNHFAGWIIHYTTGLVLSIAFWWFIESFLNNLGISVFIALGLVSGAISCVIWEATFQIHPYPVKIKLNEFYFHTFLVHLIYGIGSWIAYVIYGTVASRMPI